MSISEKTKLKLIKDKIYFWLSFDDLVFIKKYISKHWYNETWRQLLSFESIVLINRLNVRTIPIK